MSKTRRHDPRGMCQGAGMRDMRDVRVCRKCGQAVKRAAFREPEVTAYE